MKYPLIEDEPNFYPENFVCPVCKVAKVGEPHSFVSVDVGACLMNREEDWGEPSDDNDGYLSLSFHGAHDEGEGDIREIGVGLSLAYDVRSGQLCIMVCSVECLRELFSTWAGDLEAAINEGLESFK